MAEEQTNKPITSIREGSVSIAVFEGTYGRNAVLQKSYLPKEVREKLGENEKAKPEDWKRSSINLFMNEIEAVKKVVDEAYEKHKEDIEASKKKE